MKNIAIIGTVGIPACYGGFETLAEQLADKIQDKFNVTVYCSARAYREKPEKLGKISLRYINLNANGKQSILYDIRSILDALKYADTLLILGVGGCVLLPFLKLFRIKAKIVVNIDGIEWRRAKWSGAAKHYLHFAEKCAVKYADEIICDNQVIVDYVRENYGKKSQLIEYGADHLPNVTVTQTEQPYAFGVCRIEPENNVHLILETFSETPEMHLKFAGNWNNSEYGRSLYSKYVNTSNIELLDPVYDQKKLCTVRGGCALYIHGHSCGGTNPSLVEAMIQGVPIAAYDVNFNRETTENAALYFSDIADLKSIITSHSSDKNGNRMQQIALRRYTWKRIADLYMKLF